MKKLICITLALILSISMVACNGDTKSTNPSDSSNSAAKPGSAGYPFQIIESKEPIKAKMVVEDAGVIELELYPEIAPITVSNFVYLAEKGFYNGLTFHRIIKGFMIQGGDPNGTGTGGPGYTIKGEFKQNGVENNLKHERGVISMARQSMPLDSAGSQFFIMHESTESLDGSYAAFGKVTKGMDVVDMIANVKTGAQDAPAEKVIIKSIEITK